MATMRDIRRRIKTVRNIQQITKAMQMVAAARLQQAQSRATASRSYADEMLAVMNHLASVTSGAVDNPLLSVREPENIGVIVITSDRGMAGSYNSNMLRRVSQILQPYEKDHVQLVTIGKKGRTFFGNQGYKIVAEYSMPSSDVSFSEAKQISRTVADLFKEQKVDLVRLVYTRFISAMSNVITDTQLLPAITNGNGDSHKTADYIFEPIPEVLLGDLLPRYMDTQIYRAMLESLASEHGSRMTSMKSATDNAVEMIDRLTLDLNRARQAAITRELSEIVGGADALK